MRSIRVSLAAAANGRSPRAAAALSLCPGASAGNRGLHARVARAPQISDDVAFGSARSLPAPQPSINVARCPIVPPDFNHSQSFSCPHCPKEFASQRGLDHHLATRPCSRGFTCEVCHASFRRATELRLHAVVHERRAPYVCTVCGDEFKKESVLHRHMRRFSGKHQSSRRPLKLSSSIVSRRNFGSYEDVPSNRITHVTSIDARTRSIASGRLSVARHTDRQHDDVLRLESAPEVCYFAATPALHTVAFHPTHAEPEESTAALTLNLDMFSAPNHDDSISLAGASERSTSRLPLAQYRVFLASFSRSSRYPSGYRCTVLLAHRSRQFEACDWAADEQQLVELNPFDNPILECVPNLTDPHDRSSSSLRRPTWRVATSFSPPDDIEDLSSLEGHVDTASASPRLSPGRLSVVVAVAGDIELESSAAARYGKPIWIECSKVGKIDGRLFCTSCDTPFHNYHQLFSHREGTRFECPEASCSYESFNKYTLQEHVAFHHPDVHPTGGSSWTCTDCSPPKQFLSHSNLKRHSQRAHRVIRSHICPHCSDQFSIAGDLLSHLRVCHTRFHLYSCAEGQCGFTTDVRSNLNHHVIAHHADKPVTPTCDHCAFTSRDEDVVILHRRQAHSEPSLLLGV